MKRIILLGLLTFFSSISYAGDAGTTKDLTGLLSLAVEFRQKDIFEGTVGTLAFRNNGQFIELVAFRKFTVKPDQVLVVPRVYKTTKREKRENGLYYLEGEDQYGLRISGIVDTTNYKPVVDLILESGLRVVNITDDGIKFKEEFIPRVRL